MITNSHITKLSQRSKNIDFDKPQHKYSVEGVELLPVSSVLKMFYEPFDAEKQSYEYIARRGYGEREREMIKNEWKKAGDIGSSLGHSVHDFGERYFYNRNLRPTTGFEKAVVKFWNDIPEYALPVYSELMLYSSVLNCAGTADIIFIDTRNNSIIIVDYKTNKDLHKNFRGKRMLPPFEFLLDTPLNHYQLQLSLYQLLINEQNIKVNARWIVWLKETGEYELIETQDYSDIIYDKIINF